MNEILKKVIKNQIKKIIREQTENINPSIQNNISKMILKASDIKQKEGGDLKIEISKSGLGFFVMLKKYDQTGNYLYQGTFDVRGGEKKDFKCGNDFADSFEIHSHLEDDFHGIGPLFYEIALEISSKLGSGLKSGGASAQAMGVWEKYNERSDIEQDLIKTEYDLDFKQAEQYREKNLDNPFYYERAILPGLPKTPETSDDCRIKSVFLSPNYIFDKETFSQSPITKIYRKNNSNVLKKLIELDLVEIEDFSESQIII